MVKSFSPQGKNSSLETNTNYPPQSSFEGITPPPISNNIIDNLNNDFVDNLGNKLVSS